MMRPGSRLKEEEEEVVVVVSIDGPQVFLCYILISSKIR